jgi:hypothetical protein
MSSISSVSGSDPGLFQFYNSVSTGASTPAAATPTVAPADPTSATSATTPAADPQATQAAAGQHHHGHGGLFKKIESAVTDALQAAKSDPSADPNKVVEDAIAKVFKDNGVTPPAGTNSAAGVKPDSDGDGDASGQSNTVSSARQAFQQTLQGFGVNASQFHSDFLAAIKDAQSGQSDTSDSSSLFGGFPPGSLVDTTA